MPGAAPTLASRAIMLAATHWYENRGDKDDRTALRLDFAGLPPGVTRLVNLLRNKEYR